MSTRTMSIVEFNGQQVYKSDYTFAESIALLEIWKYKLIQEKIAAQNKGSGAAFMRVSEKYISQCMQKNWLVHKQWKVSRPTNDD